jgi:KTSC domain
MVILFPVASSMIAAAGYDTTNRILIVLYNTGRAYEYFDVPPEEFQGLMEAESKGKYMNSRILRIYPYAFFKGWKDMGESSMA